MNSTFSKILEILVLSRLEPNLTEASFPHLNHSAFWSTLAVVMQSLQPRRSLLGTLVRAPLCMSLFNLQKAFDSVEFPVLLDRLFSIGINGKTWRLIRNWYTGRMCFVYVDGASSTSFPIERGVCQGSILSHILFNIIMDPLQRTLESLGLGFSVNNHYSGMPMTSDPLLPPCHPSKHRSHKYSALPLTASIKLHQVWDYILCSA